MNRHIRLEIPSLATRPLLALLCLSLAGCGVGNLAAPSSLTEPTSGAAITGTVHGGSQLITGAIIKLYAVGNTGNSSAATDILTGPMGTAPLAYTTTGTTGSFSISGDYACPTNPATPVYLTATTGNPGLAGNVNNTSIALVAALGPCNALLTAGASQHIDINEATTVAAAWALAPFASSITSIGATSTNLAGITQAFAIANQLVDTSIGASPNASIASYTYVESAKLYSLADVLATCVNSSGADGKCSSLFSATTPSTGTTPADTFAAALNVVKNPGNNVGPIFSLIPGTAQPFPPLSTAPNDWTMTITYSEAQNSTGPLAGANISTIDQQGNLWGSSNSYSNINKFSPTLAPLLNINPYNLANSNTDPFFEDTGKKTGVMSIDPSGNLWVASTFSSNASTTSYVLLNPTGSILEFDNNGNLLSTAAGYTSGGIVNPALAMADTNGYVWIGNFGYYEDAQGNFTNKGGDVSLLSPTGTAESPGTGWNTSLSFLPGLINFDSSHNAWVTNTKTAQLLVFPPLTTGTGASTASPATVITIPSAAGDIVFDTLNQGWFPMSSSIGKVNINQTVGTAITGGSGLVAPSLLAIDAANRIWTINFTAASSSANGYCPPTSLSVFSGGSGGGAALSAIALGKDIVGCQVFGYGTGFLIDNAGSVLVDGIDAQSSYDPNTGTLSGYGGLTRFVGLATPTKTPNTGPPQAP